MIGPGTNPFLRTPVLSLALCALLATPLFLLLSRFKISSETRTLLESDERNLASYQKVRQILADVEVVIISIECDVFSLPGLDLIRRVSEAFAQQPGVVDVKSLTHSSRPVRRGMSFDMAPLVASPAPSAQELAALKKFCLEHPLVRNLMVAPDGRHTVVTVTYAQNFTSAETQRTLARNIDQVLAPFRNKGVKCHVLGLPLVEAEIRSTLAADTRKFVPFAAALLIGILAWSFRSGRILALIIANQAAAAALLPGLIEMVGWRLNVFTAMLLPLLLSLHLTLLIHIFSSYQRFTRQQAGEPVQALLQEVFKPSLFATLTTLTGLFSLASSEVKMVREFGLLGAGGLGFVFLATFGPGIALLKLASDRWRLKARAISPDLHGAARWSGIAEKLGQIAARQRVLVLALWGMALAIAAPGLWFVRTDIRAVEFLDPKSPTRQAVEQMDAVYGGVNIVQIELDSGTPGGANQLSFLRYVEAVHRFAEAQSEVSGIYSYAQLLAMIRQIWEGERPGSFRLPDNPLLIQLFVLALKSQDFPFLTALADPTFRTAYLVVRTRDMPSNEYLAVLKRITDFAERTKPNNVAVSAAQGIHSILEADRKILRSQISSAGITLTCVGAVLALLWRSVRLAGVALVTNAIAMVMVLGLAGFAGIPLNSITVMVAAIALGIAVDDSIHFITHWRDRLRSGAPPDQAILETLRVKSAPIIATSGILIAICALFSLSSFPPVAHFGLLLAGAFAIALAAVLLFLPAALSGSCDKILRRAPFRLDSTHKV